MKLTRWVFHNFGIKLMALLIAVATWFYVDSIKKDHTGTLLARILPSYSKMISKKLLIKAVFAGKPAEGYELDIRSISIEPQYLIVAGPKYILNKSTNLETLPIDITGMKRAVTVEAQISPIAQSVVTDKLFVKVTVPIKKLEQGPAQENSK